VSEEGSRKPPVPTEPLAEAEEPVFPTEDEVTAEYPVAPFVVASMNVASPAPPASPPPASHSPSIHDDEPTIERVVPAAVAAARREDEFRTVNISFSEILARIGPRHLGGPVPPIRDDLYTTEGGAAEVPPPSTTELDGEWNDDGGTEG
jgi:hypothetical protein